MGELRVKRAPTILKVLTANGNNITYLDEIISRTGYDKTQIQGVMWRLVKTGNVEVVMQGQAWRYVTAKPRRTNATPVRAAVARESERERVESQLRPTSTHTEKSPDLRLFEEVIKIDDVTSVVRDQNGVAYTAKFTQISN